MSVKERLERWWAFGIGWEYFKPTLFLYFLNYSFRLDLRVLEPVDNWAGWCHACGLEEGHGLD